MTTSTLFHAAGQRRLPAASGLAAGIGAAARRALAAAAAARVLPAAQSDSDIRRPHDNEALAAILLSR